MPGVNYWNVTGNFKHNFHITLHATLAKGIFPYFAFLVGSGNACWWRMLMMHADNACWWCMLVMHADDACVFLESKGIYCINLYKRRKYAFSLNGRTYIFNIPIYKYSCITYKHFVGKINNIYLIMCGNRISMIIKATKYHNNISCCLDNIVLLRMWNCFQSIKWQFINKQIIFVTFTINVLCNYHRYVVNYILTMQPFNDTH